MDIYFKREFEHPTYSFKERGACNVLLAFTPEQRVKGAVSASSGNHASAMAYHAKRLGIPCTVCMPVSAPLPKIQNCRKHGANIVLKGKNISEARKVALKLANRRGMTYINGYDHPHILAGQGVIGLEILEQVPDVDAVVLTVGGGGLLSGVSCAIKHNRPQTKIYAVESVRCASWISAMSAGKPVFTVCDHTLADGQCQL
uniref:Serine racemase n=1 Tax=Mesocestoides corti TaxID=53468 RepID=A0A5K3FTT6_MESCO